MDESPAEPVANNAAVSDLGQLDVVPFPTRTAVEAHPDKLALPASIARIAFNRIGTMLMLKRAMQESFQCGSSSS